MKPTNKTNTSISGSALPNLDAGKTQNFEASTPVGNSPAVAESAGGCVRHGVRHELLAFLGTFLFFDFDVAYLKGILAGLVFILSIKYMIYLTVKSFYDKERRDRESYK